MSSEDRGVQVEARTLSGVEWAHTKSLHAWRDWHSRDGRRQGKRALCGTTTRCDFDWSAPIEWPDGFDAARRFRSQVPVCATCREKVTDIVALTGGGAST